MSEPNADTSSAPREVPPEEWKQHGKQLRIDWGEMVSMATEGRNQAISYRDFKVGCSVLIWDANKREYRKDKAGNYKPKKDDSERGERKRCAERNVIRRAVNGSGDLIVALVIVSSETFTEFGQPERAVLHSCKDCRCLMRELVAQGVLHSQSIVLSVNDRYLVSKGQLVTEKMTVGKLLSHYPDDGDCGEDWSQKEATR